MKTDGTIVGLTVGSGSHLENKETYVEGTIQNKSRYKNINVNNIIKEVTVLLNKYDMKYELSIKILEERLYNIKNL